MSAEFRIADTEYYTWQRDHRNTRNSKITGKNPQYLQEVSASADHLYKQFNTEEQDTTWELHVPDGAFWPKFKTDETDHTLEGLDQDEFQSLAHHIGIKNYRVTKAFFKGLKNDKNVVPPEHIAPFLFGMDSPTPRLSYFPSVTSPHFEEALKRLDDYKDLDVYEKILYDHDGEISPLTEAARFNLMNDRAIIDDSQEFISSWQAELKEAGLGDFQ